MTESPSRWGAAAIVCAFRIEPGRSTSTSTYRIAGREEMTGAAYGTQQKHLVLPGPLRARRFFAKARDADSRYQCYEVVALNHDKVPDLARHPAGTIGWPANALGSPRRA
jgi:hypothetical protein